MYRQLNSRCQLIYRIAHGLTELIQSPSVHPPVEGSTDVGTGQSDLDESSSLAIESWLRVRLEQLIVGAETSSDHREENADGAENRLGWGDARDLLREIHGLDGHVQRGEGAFTPLLSLGPGIHDSKARHEKTM